MVADVELDSEVGEHLVVPQSAVLYTGARAFVFRSFGEGRFRPQEVRVGIRSGDDVEIRSGLAEGDTIVVSGTFLIASESRLRAALEQW
jgi:Cu(I)/Ag(I) efflux system membrane fusion protein